MLKGIKELADDAIDMICESGTWMNNYFNEKKHPVRNFILILAMSALGAAIGLLLSIRILI